MPVKLSIITPVKNAEPWIADCIDSVLNQNFQDWEWIFVDDHSTDASPDVISRSGKRDPRIQLYQNKGRGIIPALQQALEKCSGEFITRMDADDLMPAGRISTMLKELESSPSKTIVTGLVEYFTTGDISPGYRKYEAWINDVLLANEPWQNIYRECVIASPNWIMRSEDLIQCGGFENLEYPEDYDLVFRWYRNNFKIVCIPQITLLWREHPERTSRNSDHYSQDSFYRLKLKRFLEIDFDKEKDLCLWGTGIKAKISVSLLKAQSIPFIRMGLRNTDQEEYVGYYKDIEKLSNPQLLIAVYPPQPEMELMLAYLHSLSFVAGKDYWFL